jgi:hypothetical protein
MKQVWFQHDGSVTLRDFLNTFPKLWIIWTSPTYPPLINNLGKHTVGIHQSKSVQNKRTAVQNVCIFNTSDIIQNVTKDLETHPNLHGP